MGPSVYNLENNSVYVTREDRTGWTSHMLAVELGRRFHPKNTLVISETWMMDEDLEIVREWLDKDSSNKVLSMSLLDPIGSARRIINTFDQSRITYIGSADVCACLLFVDRHFLNYSVEEVAPTGFEYNFLCYQRKPTGHRPMIYNALKNKNGIVTIGTESYDFNTELPNHDGLNEVGHEDIQLPADIFSLGNISVWNKSFLNIVSETNQALDKDELFISEKIFKPIIGLRPFIHLGHPKTSEFMRSLGFETFDEDFGYTPTDDMHVNLQQVTHIVDNIDNTMYNRLLPKLLYNKNWISQAAKNEWTRFDKLVDKINNTDYL